MMIWTTIISTQRYLEEKSSKKKKKKPIDLIFKSILPWSYNIFLGLKFFFFFMFSHVLVDLLSINMFVCVNVYLWETTVNDYWRMAWENHMEIIFMACRIVEMGKVKSEGKYLTYLKCCMCSLKKSIFVV